MKLEGPVRTVPTALRAVTGIQRSNKTSRQGSLSTYSFLCKKAMCAYVSVYEFACFFQKKVRINNKPKKMTTPGGRGCRTRQKVDVSLMYLILIWEPCKCFT